MINADITDRSEIVCCIDSYECAERGCYAESVGVLGCSGVKSRLAQHEAGMCGAPHADHR